MQDRAEKLKSLGHDLRHGTLQSSWDSSANLMAEGAGDGVAPGVAKYEAVRATEEELDAFMADYEELLAAADAFERARPTLRTPAPCSGRGPARPAARAPRCPPAPLP